MIYAIDPGTTQSALVVFTGTGVYVHHTMPNEAMLKYMRSDVMGRDDILVVEQIAAMGMAVGAEVFETCVWSGRFIEAWDNNDRPWTRLKRLPIKIHLCGQARAKDANIRRVLMDRFGGDASVKKGGALYKLKGDEWAALAVAVTYYDLYVAAPARAFDVLQETRE